MHMYTHNLQAFCYVPTNIIKFFHKTNNLNEDRLRGTGKLKVVRQINIKKQDDKLNPTIISSNIR